MRLPRAMELGLSAKPSQPRLASSIQERQDGQPYYITLMIPRASSTDYATILLGTTPFETQLVHPSGTLATTTASDIVGGTGGTTTNSSSPSNGLQIAFVVLSVIIGIILVILLWYLCLRQGQRVIMKGLRGARGALGPEEYLALPGEGCLPGMQGIQGIPGAPGPEGPTRRAPGTNLVRLVTRAQMAGRDRRDDLGFKVRRELPGGMGEMARTGGTGH